MAGILFIVSAPSGSGKSTLVTQLFSLVGGLEFSVSYTTRPPRGSETDGREYHFVTRAAFEAMVAAGEFLEWAEVFGNYYGTALGTLDHARAEGKDLLLDIDVQGAVQVMQRLPAAVSIFIMPPSPRVLEMRLRNRSEAENQTSRADTREITRNVTQDIIARRLAQANEELHQLGRYRYALVNDVLDQAVQELRAIVLAERDEGVPERALAESCRTDRASPRLQAALASFMPE